MPLCPCYTEMTDLAFCTSYEDETSADEEHHASVQNISKLEGIAPKGLPNNMCETSAR